MKFLVIAVLLLGLASAWKPQSKRITLRNDRALVNSKNNENIEQAKSSEESSEEKPLEKKISEQRVFGETSSEATNVNESSEVETTKEKENTEEKTSTENRLRPAVLDFKQPRIADLVKGKSPLLQDEQLIDTPVPTDDSPKESVKTPSSEAEAPEESADTEAPLDEVAQNLLVSSSEVSNKLSEPEVGEEEESSKSLVRPATLDIKQRIASLTKDFKPLSGRQALSDDLKEPLESPSRLTKDIKPLLISPSEVPVAELTTPEGPVESTEESSSSDELISSPKEPAQLGPLVFPPPREPIKFTKFDIRRKGLGADDVVRSHADEVNLLATGPPVERKQEHLLPLHETLPEVDKEPKVNRLAKDIPRKSVAQTDIPQTIRKPLIQVQPPKTFSDTRILQEIRKNENTGADLKDDKENPKKTAEIGGKQFVVVSEDVVDISDLFSRPQPLVYPIFPRRGGKFGPAISRRISKKEDVEAESQRKESESTTSLPQPKPLTFQSPKETFEESNTQ